MSYKFAWIALALAATTLAGCTSGGGDGDSDTTSTSGGVGVGGTVSGPAGGVGGNATVSGSATGTSTNSTPEANMTADVDISGNAFKPSSVTIGVGGSVTWTHNDGTTAHTVTADDGSFNSSPTCAGPVAIQADCLTQGEKFTATFATAGTFAYHCKIHSSMTGTVTVVEP